MQFFEQSLIRLGNIPPVDEDVLEWTGYRKEECLTAADNLKIIQIWPDAIIGEPYETNFF
jgi:hypothetical protein